MRGTAASDAPSTAEDESAEAPPAAPHNGRAGGGRRHGRPSPRRNQNVPPVAPLAPSDSDSAFVNGGAVYADTEAANQRSWQESAGDAAATHRIGERAPSPTDETTRVRRTDPVRRRGDRSTRLDPGQTGPIEPQRSPEDGGPSTAVGLAPPGAETWHRDRTSRRAADGGPATEASAPFDLDDEDDVADGFADLAPDAGDPPAGLPAAPKRRRRSSAPASAGQAWAAVVAQWIAGAIGGAALWVGFRFLWRDLQVVALAAAVLVTVGLVLVVRALMHNDDRRTTLFAVLVGLLLTVSPAILVLLGR
jgi:hypothetical protein